MSLENRLHLQSEDPDLLIEFDLPPGTHATIGASPKSEITLPLTGIPPFSCVLGRFQDGHLFIAGLDFCVIRRVDLPEIISIPPYQFVLFHPAEPEAQPDPAAAPEDTPSPAKSRDQITSRIRALFRKPPAPPQESPAVEDAPAEPPTS